MKSQRTSRPLDMLPLLDVMMVILFAFATVQEGTLEETKEQESEAQQELVKLQEERDKLADQNDQLRKERNEAKAELEAANLEERAQQLEKCKKENKNLSELLEDKLKENRDLKELSQALEASVQDVSKDLEQCLELAQTKEVIDQERKDQVLETLLEKNKVLEIEMKGQTVSGAIVNHCCYRTDPLSKNWKSCGQVSPDPEIRASWFRDDRHGLAKALRTTLGGNAITIIRHDNTTTYEIGDHLTDLIREQVPEQKVYNEGVAVVEAECLKR